MVNKCLDVYIKYFSTDSELAVCHVFVCVIEVPTSEIWWVVAPE